MDAVRDPSEVGQRTTPATPAPDTGGGAPGPGSEQGASGDRGPVSGAWQHPPVRAEAGFTNGPPDAVRPTTPLGSRREVSQAVSPGTSPQDRNPRGPDPQAPVPPRPHPSAGQERAATGIPPHQAAPPAQQEPLPAPHTAYAPPPARSGRERAPQRGGRISPLGWALRGAGLLAISLVSGLVWLAVKPGPAEQEGGTDPGTSAEQGVPPGRYEFVAAGREEWPGCERYATGRIAEFFAEHPCEHLTRALYTTRLPNGDRVLTSIVTALMPDEAAAHRLEALTQQNGTGNIEDLESAGRAYLENAPSLGRDLGYASVYQGRLVIIGESAYFGNEEHEDQRLVGVTQDALRLGHKQDAGGTSGSGR